MTNRDNDRPPQRRRKPPDGRKPGRQPPGKNAGKRRRPPRVGLIPATAIVFQRLGYSLSRSPLIPIIGGLLALGSIIFAVVWMLTNKNAYDVYVGDEYITSISRDRDISAEWIANNALARLAADLQTSVQVDLEVEITPANRQRNRLSSTDYAIGAVYQTFRTSPFKQQAADIVINGDAIATLSNESIALSLLDTIMRSYAPAGAEIVRMEWLDDDVQVVPRYAAPEEIEIPERVLAVMTHKTEQESTYQIRSGDTIYHIGRRQGLSHERLIELNPNIPEVRDGNIRAGQQITIVTPRPLYSVRTVEVITYNDVERRFVEERPTASLAPGARGRVIQEGRDGTREVTAHLTRIDGVEQERQEITSRTLIPAVPEIVEVGI